MKWFFGFLNLVVGLGLIMIATGPVKAVEFYSLLEGDSSGKELSYDSYAFVGDDPHLRDPEGLLEADDQSDPTLWQNLPSDFERTADELQEAYEQQEGGGWGSDGETPWLELPSDLERTTDELQEAYEQQETFFGGTGGTGGTGGGGAGDFSGLVDLIISRVLNPIVIFLFAVGVVIFLWGMIKYLGKMDNDDERKKWLNLMVYGLLIMFVMFSVWGFVNILLGTVFPSGVGQQPPIPQF